MNIANNLEHAARFFPDHTAVIEGDQQWSYAELNRRSGLIAAGLSKLGMGPGDHVALCAPNSAQWMAIYFGVLKCGAVAVTLSAQHSREEFEMLIGHSRPKAIYTTEGRREQLVPFLNSGPLELVIAPGGDITASTLMEKGVQPLKAVERDREDIACILYTGGTTGVPKGVMLSHENVNTAVFNVAHYERSSHNDRALCFLPFNHGFGQLHILIPTALSAGGLVLLPNFDLEAVLAAIEEHRVTKIYAVPTIYVRLLQVPDLGRRMETVRYCFSAAASMAREVVLQWKDATGLDIHEAYGMTETASIVTYNHYHRHRVGSVGTMVGTTEVSIRDESGNLLPAGDEGEICIRGRNVMTGYLNNPQADKEAFHDDWLRSGDVGYLDEDGYLYIVDRLKDMIITGGENVYPREVEEILYTLPEVVECAVIGLPDVEYGERVTAYLILKEGAGLEAAELKSYCKARLSPFKVPKEFVYVDSFPTSPNGKILKRELRRVALAKK